jgi:hypothetical protein
MRTVLSLVGLAVVSTFTAFLHHGHIAMFLTSVREQVSGKIRARLSHANISQDASRLTIAVGESRNYEVSVHRKTRSVDVALNVAGTDTENESAAEAIAAASEGIRVRLGRAELEQLPARRIRLISTRTLSTNDWSPKRDLTREVVHDTSDLLLRFVEVLEPILGRRTRRPARVQPKSRRQAAR